MTYYCVGKIEASNPVKLCVNLGWFFIDNFGLVNSFRLALFMARDMVRLHMWEPFRCLGKSIRERLNAAKVIPNMIILSIS